MAEKDPVTPAIRALRQAGAAFVGHTYPYVEQGGTRASSAALGVPEHQVIKTLILQTDTGTPLVALMHGNREVSTKNLARVLGVRSVQPCTPADAQRHSGYQIGGTSPFGLKKRLPIYAQTTIQELPQIWINGGKRGFLVSIAPTVLTQVLGVTWVEIAA